MPDPLTHPGVGDMDEPVPGLDDRRVGKLRALFFFERQDPFPALPVPGEGDGEDAAAFGNGVIDQDVPAVAKGHGVDAGVRVGEYGRFRRGPGDSAVRAPGRVDPAGRAPHQGDDAVCAGPQEGRLDQPDGLAVVDGRCFGPGPGLIFRYLKVDAPALILRGAAAEESPIGELNGMVLDRPEDPFRQGPRSQSSKAR